MSRQYDRVVGIAPSIVDIHHFYNTTAEWQESLDALNLAPGEWAEVDDTSEEQRQALAALPTSSIKAGSSILAAMAVLPEEVKRHSTLYATSAHDAKGEEALGSIAFRESAHQWGIGTQAIPLRGSNPTVHVLVDPVSGERSFLKDTGVSRDISELPDRDQLQREDTIVCVDAYELTSGTTGEVLRDVIGKAPGNIALSLGNVAILSDELVRFIRDAGERGSLYSLFGNADEFAILLGVTPYAGQLLRARMTLRANLSVTRGGGGISLATVDGTYYHAEAPQVRPRDIVSTSGAGDAAMGIVLGGLIEGEQMKTVLGQATAHCARVIQTADDIIPR